METKKYHDRSLVLSYNCSLMFICLVRGVGKTFTYKRFCIERFINNSEQFVVIRRYTKEVNECREKFFKDVLQYYPDHKIEVRGSNIYIDKKQAGCFIALSKASYYKSSAYPFVYNILFDEALPEGKYNRYLPDECDAFANLICTIVRRRDFRCFIIFNRISTITPYNIYFNLPPFDKNYYDKKRGILVWCDEKLNASTNDKNEESMFSKVFDGTNYKKYAIDGTRSLSGGEDDRIKKRNKTTSNLIYIINNSGKYFGVFIDNKTLDVYIDANCDLTYPIKYNFDVSNLRDCEKLFDKTTNHAKIVKNAMRYGYLYYNDLYSKMISYDVIKKF